MKKDYTHVLFLIDGSGSMEPVANAVRNGTNRFLKEQADMPGKCTVTVVIFNDKYHKVIDFGDVKNVKKLTKDNYKPNGATAYLYAFGRATDETGKQLAAMPESERPDKVVMVVYTDGEENHSQWIPGHSYTEARCFAMKEHQEKVYNWQVLFLGGKGAFKQAQELGIDASKSLVVDEGNAQALDQSYNILSQNIGLYRKTGQSKSLVFTQDQRNLTSNLGEN